MEDQSSYLWGVLVSACSIAFGWFLNQLSGWWRVKRDDKKILKLVLFNLLELEHSINKLNLEPELGSILNEYVEKIAPIEVSDEEKNEVRNHLVKILFSFLKTVTTNELDVLESKYQNAVSQLSGIAPLRAYYLSDKTRLFEKLKFVENWVDYASGHQVGAEISFEEAKSKFNEIAATDLIKTALKDIRREIVGIAWQINPVCWYRVKRLLKANAEPNPEMSEKINSVLQQILPLIKKAL